MNIIKNISLIIGFWVMGSLLTTLHFHEKTVLAENLEIEKNLMVYSDKSLGCADRIRGFSTLIESLKDNDELWPIIKKKMTQVLEDPKEDGCAQYQAPVLLYDMPGGETKVIELFYDEDHSFSKNLDRIDTLLNVLTDKQSHQSLDAVYHLMDQILNDSSLSIHDRWTYYLLRKIGLYLARINPPEAVSALIERYEGHNPKFARMALDSFVLNQFNQEFPKSQLHLSPDEKIKLMSVLGHPRLDASEDAFFILVMFLLTVDHQSHLDAFLTDYAKQYANQMTPDRQKFIKEFLEHMAIIQAQSKELEIQLHTQDSEISKDDDNNIYTLFMFLVSLGISEVTRSKYSSLTQQIGTISEEFSRWFNQCMSFVEHAQ